MFRDECLGLDVVQLAYHTSEKRFREIFSWTCTPSEAPTYDEYTYKYREMMGWNTKSWVRSVK